MGVPWQHKMDPLVKTELDRLENLINSLITEMTRLTEENKKLLADQKEIEDKMDELLGKMEAPRSIIDSGEAENAKPEVVAMSPGYIPWSKRKQGRIAKTANPSAFTEKVLLGATPKKKETQPEAKEENK
jgi:predicted nuclease with TOPRIM domain